MRKNFRLILLILIFPLLTLFSFCQDPDVDEEFSLEIANPNPVGSGARALGQANAFIAIADDATAASWNPAGLLQLEKPEISFALEIEYLSNEINSSLHPESEGSDSLRLEDFNYASVVYPFHWGTNMVVSLNYLKLFRFDKEARVPAKIMNSFPTGIAEEKDLIYDFDQNGSFSVLAPGFGLDIAEKLSVGVTVKIWNHDITQSSSFEKKEFTSGTQTTTIFDLPTGQGAIPVEFREVNKFEVDEGYSVVIGGMYRLNDQWNFGIVLKPPFDLDLDHKRIAGNLPLEMRRADLEMPMIIGGGIGWRPYDPLSVSLDITWTEWSEYAFVQSDTTRNPLTSRTGDNVKLEDTFTARIGGEYLIIRDNFIVPLRCGFGYDPSPAVDDVDDFYTLNFGTGIQLGPYNLDVAYEFRWGIDVNRHFLEPLDATQDVFRHRILASMIYYF